MKCVNIYVNMVFRCAEEKNGRRFSICSCVRGGKHVYLATVINGVDQVPVKRHEVEDHLIMLAKEVMNINLVHGFNRSKDLWKKLEKDYRINRYELFKQLSGRDDLLEKMLPQHLQALRLLMSL